MSAPVKPVGLKFDASKKAEEPKLPSSAQKESKGEGDRFQKKEVDFILKYLQSGHYNDLLKNEDQ